MAEWIETTVGGILDQWGGEIKTGPFGTHLKASEYSREGVPLISVGEIGYGSIMLHAKTPRVPPEVTRRLPEYLLKEGDIVFGRKGAVDRSARVKQEQDGWFLGSDGIRLRLPTQCSSFFISYVLQTFAHKAWITQHATGSTMVSLNQDVIRRIPICLPDRNLQDAIAGVLGALDDKIELNRRMNETLEAMARAIFRDWFVDFGPTRAKQEAMSAGGTTGKANNTARNAASTTGNANNAGREPYLAPEIWSLFPDRLDADGKPEGWKLSPLLKHARLISGGTPKTDRPEYWNGPIAWASAKDVSQCGQAFLIDTERKITEEGLEKSATRIIPALSTVVVARGATTGRHCMFGREIAMNQTCYALDSLTGHPYWLRCAFEALVNNLVHSAHGSVFDTITTRTIQNANVMLPEAGLIDAFEQTVEAMFARILSNTLNSRTLAEIRDLLLPKLMSGEIRVREAEKAVEDVA